ncbi:MAG: hypothetical protein JW751_01825 [Polyangiaceae bacterium]|nr:hypothetical protein [Polyangiaceae bacterium]
MRDRATIGPFPSDLIVLGIERGKVPIEAEIRREGTTIWRPLASVPAFFRAMGLDRVPLPAPRRVAAQTDDDDVTRINASPTHIPLPTGGPNGDEDDEDDEATRVLDALTFPRPRPNQDRARRDGPPPPAQGGPPPARTGPPPPARTGPPPAPRRLPPFAETGDDNEAATTVHDHPPSLEGAIDPGMARPAATRDEVPRRPLPAIPTRPLPAPPEQATRPEVQRSPATDLLPPVRRSTAAAAALMDADDDENDVRGVHVGLTDTPGGSIRPAAGVPSRSSPPAKPVGPSSSQSPLLPSGRPPPPIRQPPASSDHPMPSAPSGRPPRGYPGQAYGAARADELTGPARRLRRDHHLMSIALIILALGFLATLGVLLWLVIRT